VTHNQIVNKSKTINKEDELHDYYKRKRKAPTIPMSLDSLLKQPKKGIFA